ncbi:hypothetical protein INT44_006150 [Umbelopsis vinacea]|uniref:C2H2-type domain-containing protein n=1 Tax=Umbelopsis vinacea TaxID=44442 RepID=A0A8H7PSX8_9FUNG|nr:hypothetical protein INT44_006150 [Umbelopsis vinacea]
MPADRQFLPSIKHLLLREEDDVHPWSAALHQHVVTDYEPVSDHDMSLNSAAFYKPMKDCHVSYPPRQSPTLEIHRSPSSTPVSSPAASWSPPSSDISDPQPGMWGSTVTDQQQTQRHWRSMSEASQVQDFKPYHRRQSAGDRQSSTEEVPRPVITQASAFKNPRLEDDHVSDSTPSPPHENGIIVFGTKNSQSSSQHAGGGHRYICPDCNKTFARPSSLRVHSYSHTGEKPYACPEPSCGRRFSVCSNLRRHMRVHRLRHDPPQWKPKASIDSSSTSRATSI